MDGKSTLFSALCGRVWMRPLYLGCHLLFEEDGTGEFVCGFERNIHIAAVMNWRALGDSEALLRDVVVDLSLGEEFDHAIDVEITITRRHIPRYLDIPQRNNVQGPVFHDRHLGDDGFKPKIYTVHLAKGKYTGDTWLDFSSMAPEDRPHYKNWWGIRLLFDKSPFPTLHEWKQDEKVLNGVTRYRFWEDNYRDFYQNSLEDVMDEKTAAEIRAKKEAVMRKFKLGPYREQRDGPSEA